METTTDPINLSITDDAAPCAAPPASTESAALSEALIAWLVEVAIGHAPG
jgi:hypothetical protein